MKLVSARYVCDQQTVGGTHLKFDSALTLGNFNDFFSIMKMLKEHKF